jgi:hypothetical protein
MAQIEMVCQPSQTIRLADFLEAATHRILAEDLLHAQQERVDRIAPQSGDMGVTAMAGQNRQHHRAQQVTLGWCVRTGQEQRTVRHPGVEQACLLQVVDEEWQLSKRCDRSRVVPLDMHTAGEGVRCD